MIDKPNMSKAAQSAKTVDQRPIKVAQVLDEFTVVINRGTADGLREGQRVLIYTIGDDVMDPDTGESLGKLEVVKGTGKVRHLQDRMATVTSDMKAPAGRTIRTGRSPLAAAMLGISLGPEEEILPATRVQFEDAAVGDLVRLI